MRRRDALKTLGALAGSAYTTRLLAACGDNLKVGNIDTFVFLVMENRSYDHYLGARSFEEGLPGDGLRPGLSNPNELGEEIKPYPASDDVVSQCVANDPPHGRNDGFEQLASGTNTGFLSAHERKHGFGASECMSYLSRRHVPVTNALADSYTSCDRWFSSFLGPTLPNRMYFHAGQSNGAINNQQVLDGAFDGIDTIHHQLERAGIDWKYYYGDVPVIAVLDDLPLTDRLARFNNQFLIDAEQGKLPAVSFIDPSFSANDDHPPHHPLLGQQLIAATYQALADSPQWERCMMVVLYDECGGFYDHVPPPKAVDDRAAEGFDQLGFRIPGLVVGPYVKQGHVSSVQYDHTSVIRHLQTNFELDDLTLRSASANDFRDCIDFERLARGQAAPPIQLPAVTIDELSLPNRCGGASFRETSLDHDILQWAAHDPARFARWDRQAESISDLYDIADYLEAKGLGGIKR